MFRSPGSGSGSVRSVALWRVTETGGDPVCLLELADGRHEGDLGPQEGERPVSRVAASDGH